MISHTVKSMFLKNLSIFSDTSIAIAIGNNSVNTKATELKYFLSMYLSRILNFSFQFK